MFVDVDTLGDGARLEAEVAIVGAGPAGIVTALELGRAGIDVLLVESGRERFDPDAQRLSDAAWRSDTHVDMALAVRRQVGGTSTIWGGRCVPYDPIDFDARAIAPDAAWPVAYDEVTPYFGRACEWFVCGRPVFDAQRLPGLAGRTLVPGLADGELRSSDLERWSLPTRFGSRYRAELEASDRVRLVAGLTCTRVVADTTGARVDRLTTRTLDGKQVEVHARRYVLAANGLETTRLLLASGLGDASGHLGRWYMAHTAGRIAVVRFTTDPRETIYDHERDEDGVYVRRRLSFSRDVLQRSGLPNIVFWLVNPELGDPGHRSGVLSFAYLALSSPLGRFFAPAAIRASMTKSAVPGSRRAHAANVVRDLPRAVAFALSFGYRRFLKRGRRAPGFFTYSPSNTYLLQYHGEHLPNADSRVSLSDELDAVGMPRLAVDMRFSDADVDGVVRAHRELDEQLRRAGVGRLEYLAEDLGASVRAQLEGGYHQTGTTRMSARPEDGVVDPDLAVHGCEGLYVASGSAFPTSSQANTTFMVVAFALRLADHLRELREAT